MDFDTLSLQLSQLSEVECQHMLNHHLSLKQKILNPEQMKMALSALKQCPVPLFLSVMMRQLRDWKSYTVIQEPLPTTIDGIRNSYMLRIG